MDFGFSARVWRRIFAYQFPIVLYRTERSVKRNVVNDKNTFITFGVYDFISLPLCVFFSYVLYKKVAASSFFRVVFYFPSLLSIVALALVFYFIVDVKGPIALEFNSIGLNYPSPFGREGSAFAWIMVFCVWSGFGYSIVLFRVLSQGFPSRFSKARKSKVALWRANFSL